MKQTVARVSEDGLTLREWDFILARMGEHDICFRFVAFRLWQRLCAKDEIPWLSPPAEWRAVDLFDRNDIKETPDVPDDVLQEARQWIIQKIIFEI